MNTLKFKNEREFQKKLKDSIEFKYKDSIVIKIPDATFNPAARFIPKKPCDMIVWNNNFFALELKYTKGSAWRFDSLKPHQYDFLVEVNKKGGSGFIVLGFNENYFMINPAWLKSYEKISNKKSINLKELKIATDCRDVSEIMIAKIGRKTIIDIEL